MLKPGWDDDLKAFVKSWAPADRWLRDAETIRRTQWLNGDRTNLQRLFGKFLDDLPNELSRGEIFGQVKNPDSNILESFLWAMAWGHNGTNYGAARVDEIVGDPDTEAKLAEIIGLAQEGDFKAAFHGLHGEFRLRKLATSFGSKLIYFAGFDPTSEESQPLILDQLVAKAIDKVIDPSSGERTSWVYQTKKWDHYWAYCDLVRRMRDLYVPDARIDMVEAWLWLVGGGVSWQHDAIRRNGKYPLP